MKRYDAISNNWVMFFRYSGFAWFKAKWPMRRFAWGGTGGGQRISVLRELGLIG